MHYTDAQLRKLLASLERYKKQLEMSPLDRLKAVIEKQSQLRWHIEGKRLELATLEKQAEELRQLIKEQEKLQ